MYAWLATSGRSVVFATPKPQINLGILNYAGDFWPFVDFAYIYSNFLAPTFFVVL